MSCRFAFIALFGLSQLLITIVLPVSLATGQSNATSNDSLTKTDRDNAVAKIASLIDETYFDSAVAERIASVLRSNLESGNYTSIDDKKTLAAKLTDELQTMTKDKHLNVMVRPVVAASLETPNKPPVDDRAEMVRRNNAGIQKIEILPNNIGYVNIKGFYREQETRPVLQHAMGFLQNVDSLILDCRENGGGSPEGVIEWMTVLVDEPNTELFEIRSRSGSVKSYATDRSKHNVFRKPNVPVYVVVSAETFSAGEGFAFLLKERDVATIVGETTAGAANPGRIYEVNEHFEIQIPNGCLKTSKTQSNWEGGGVLPDIRCDRKDALNVAVDRVSKQMQEVGRR